MVVKAVSTYEAKIYCGLKEGYDGRTHILAEVELICQAYCNQVGFAVTITGTKFVYKNGYEDGVIVGLINYPRFPSTKKQIREHAIAIAKKLQSEFKQQRVSIVFSDKTMMLDATERGK